VDIEGCEEGYLGTINYWCRREAEVTVPAGTFETYEIKKVNFGDDPNSEYGYIYYSPVCKSFVKMVEYETDNVTGENIVDDSWELTAFHLKREDGNGFAAFEATFLIIAITCALFAIRKKKD
jgi:hypothetical protein